MAPQQPKLPGTSTRRRRGRIRRALDDAVTDKRKRDGIPKWLAAEVAALRSTADKLDDDAEDADVSAFAYAAAASKYLDALEELRPAPTLADELGDWLNDRPADPLAEILDTPAT